MKRIILMAALIIGIGALATTTEQAAAEYTLGVHYEKVRSRVPTNDPDTVEVRELFWYGCPHCFDVEEFVEEWMADKPDDVNFVRQPAIFSKRWAPFAQVYYTAETLGVLDSFHKAFFTAIHKKNRKFKNVEEIRDFFIEQGVDGAKFDKAWKSFAVNTKLNRATQLTPRYGATGVPVVIVNGKYRTGAKLAGGNDAIFKVVNFLVEKERDERKAKTASVSGK